MRLQWGFRLGLHIRCTSVGLLNEAPLELGNVH